MMSAGFDELAGDGEQLDPKIPGDDLAALGTRAKDNEHLAHNAAEPKVAELPTHEDLHDAIDFVGDLYKKYG
jgi:hypothetical protein